MNLPRALIWLPALLLVFSSLHAEPGKAPQLEWMTNYEKAVDLAQKTQRPIVLFFTGSDWCGWCNKLEKEALDTKEFMGMTADKLIFVKLDFPMKTKLEPHIAEQNQRLKKKFSIRGFPSIVVLDPDQQPVGVTGYRPGGGKKYAQHLIKMVNEYAAYKQQMKRLSSHQFSGKELKRLYQKAHELGLKNEQNLLIRIGMDSDLAPFFITERYRYLADNGQLRSNEAASLRERLLSIDPDNKTLSHYQVAVIDFETSSRNENSRENSPEKTVAPLIAYIDTFGKEDEENLWRLNLLISQVYLDNSLYEKSLKFAKRSLTTAPQSIQPDIAATIDNIQTKISTESP